eukprot:jgi/Mesvir1/21720/Mv04132-RA.1
MDGFGGETGLMPGMGPMPPHALPLPPPPPMGHGGVPAHLGGAGGVPGMGMSAAAAVVGPGARVITSSQGSRPGVARCPDFESGVCFRGNMCPFDHGDQRIVVDDVQALNRLREIAARAQTIEPPPLMPPLAPPTDTYDPDSYNPEVPLWRRGGAHPVGAGATLPRDPHGYPDHLGAPRGAARANQEGGGGAFGGAGGGGGGGYGGAGPEGVPSRVVEALGEGSRILTGKGGLFTKGYLQGGGRGAVEEKNAALRGKGTAAGGPSPHSGLASAPAAAATQVHAVAGPGHRGMGGATGGAYGGVPGEPGARPVAIPITAPGAGPARVGQGEVMGGAEMDTDADAWNEPLREMGGRSGMGMGGGVGGVAQGGVGRGRFPPGAMGRGAKAPGFAPPGAAPAAASAAGGGIPGSGGVVASPGVGVGPGGGAGPVGVGRARRVVAGGGSGVGGGAVSTLYVHGIPPELRRQDLLYNHFKQFGLVLGVRLASGPDATGSDKAFVMMSTRQEAETARSSPVSILGNRFIQTNWAHQDVFDPERAAQLIELHAQKKKDEAGAGAGAGGVGTLSTPHAATHAPDGSSVLAPKVGTPMDTGTHAGIAARAKVEAAAHGKPVGVAATGAVGASPAADKKRKMSELLQIQKQKEELLLQQIEQQRSLLEKLQKAKGQPGTAAAAPDATKTPSKLPAKKLKLSDDTKSEVGETPPVTVPSPAGKPPGTTPGGATGIGPNGPTPHVAKPTVGATPTKPGAGQALSATPSWVSSPGGGMMGRGGPMVARGGGPQRFKLDNRTTVIKVLSPVPELEDEGVLLEHFSTYGSVTRVWREPLATTKAPWPWKRGAKETMRPAAQGRGPSRVRQWGRAASSQGLRGTGRRSRFTSTSRRGAWQSWPWRRGPGSGATHCSWSGPTTSSRAQWLPRLPSRDRQQSEAAV